MLKYNIHNKVTLLKTILIFIKDKVFKNGSSKICAIIMDEAKILKRYGQALNKTKFDISTNSFFKVVHESNVAIRHIFFTHSKIIYDAFSAQNLLVLKYMLFSNIFHK